MQESEVIRLARPVLEGAREGLQVANGVLAGCEVIVRVVGSPRATFCSRTDWPFSAVGAGLPPNHDFWYVSLEFETRGKDGSPLACADDVEQLGVLVDDVTGDVVWSHTL